jgi:hypothetical protein
VSESRRADAIALSILALLPILLFADVLLGINSFYTRDITNYYYPAKKLLREIVLGGHFPYWNPWFSAGQPLAANPEHAVFYPLTWLILLPRYDLAFHLQIVAHLYIALFGMFALLRSMALSRPAASLGAISFGLGGVILSTVDLTPCLFSMAWVPLTCLFTRRYLESHAPRDGVLASLFLGVQLLIGEPATAIQTGILLGMYAMSRGIRDGRPASNILRRVATIGAISVTSLLVAAVQVLPALDHFGDSVRSRGLDYYLVHYWSTPLARVAELVYPSIFGNVRLDGPWLYWGSGLYEVEKTPFFSGIYCGLLVAVLLLGGLVARARGSGLMAAIGAVSLVLAFGRHTPLLRILFDAGIATWLRYPEKFLFMGIFAMVVFAATVLERLLQGDEKVRRAVFWSTVAITSFAFAVSLLSQTGAYEPLFRSIWKPIASSPIDAMLALSKQGWLLAFARGLMLLILLRNFDRVRRATWLALLGAFVILDLSMMVPELTPRVSSSFHRDPPLAARQFPDNRDDFRLFHQAAWNQRAPAASLYHQPSSHRYWTSRNAFAPMMPAAYGLRTAMEPDYDRTQLLPTADFTDAAWDLAAKRPQDWGEVVASMSNIWYVGVHRTPREAIALAHGDPHEIQPVRFAELPHYPRYYFASRLVTIQNRNDFVRVLSGSPDPRGIACVYEPAFRPAPGVVRGWNEWTNGARIDVEAAERAFLVMSVTPHKYWSVTIDGSAVDSIVTNVGYQGVIVPAGRHVVTMEYRNPLIAVGASISMFTILAMMLVARRRALSTGRHP